MRRPPEPGRGRAALTPVIVEKIVGLIEDWSDARPLTWAAVVAQVAGYLRHHWTRQGLERHPRIKEAYEAKRAAYREYRRTGKVLKPRLPEDEHRRQQIARLTGELEAARRMLSNYDERLVRLQAAALRHGLTIAQLEADLVPVERGVTDPPVKGPKRRSA